MNYKISVHFHIRFYDYRFYEAQRYLFFYQSAMKCFFFKSNKNISTKLSLMHLCVRLSSAVDTFLCLPERFCQGWKVKLLVHDSLHRLSTEIKVQRKISVFNFGCEPNQVVNSTVVYVPEVIFIICVYIYCVK